MVTHFTSPSQGKLFSRIRSGLARLGYRGELLAEDYGFRDCFAHGNPERIAALAGFGRLPASYETACFSVLVAGDKHGESLIGEHRALGAPFAIEVGAEAATFWKVGANSETTTPLLTFSLGDVDEVFAKHHLDWLPDRLLRAKSVSIHRSPEQLLLFDDGLIPEIEERIRERLDPMMRKACKEAVKEFQRTSGGKKPDMEQLFSLAFWILAAKVFRDRGIEEFSSLSSESDPDEVLAKVAHHYDEKDIPSLLNHATRAIVLRLMWSSLDFRNLSTDVLTAIWANTFVTKEIRKALGIHSTPRWLAQYVVESLPVELIPIAQRIVIEPCCGSGVFLVAAMHRLRDLLPADSGPIVSHNYLRHRLVGFELEAFGIEITRLSLMLADFPNPNGWQLYQGDVFRQEAFKSRLAEARIVLCNPPFENLPKHDRIEISAKSIPKPAEILSRVIAQMHPEGMLGFVVPHNALDGVQYSTVRSALANRFSSIDIVTLPQNNIFETANHPSALLMAHGKQTGNKVAISHRRVAASNHQLISISEHSETRTLADAEKSIAIPLLREIWHALRFHPRLNSVATAHRGIEWVHPLTKDGRETGYRDIYVADSSKAGFIEGLAPRALPFYAFESPPTKFLCVDPQELRRGAHLIPKFPQPKIILNAKRKSQQPWRLAAFADFNGLAFYQTFTGVWPHEPSNTISLAAALNGPIANAFVASHEIRDNTNDTFDGIPVPVFSEGQRVELEALVTQYQKSLGVSITDLVEGKSGADPDALLRRIDAIVLSAYDLPPRLERMVLDFFNGAPRQVPFSFHDYFPQDFEPCFSLHEYLSDEFQQSTAGAWKKRFRQPSPEILKSLNAASKAFGAKQ